MSIFGLIFFWVYDDEIEDYFHCCVYAFFGADEGLVASVADGVVSFLAKWYSENFCKEKKFFELKNRAKNFD